MIKNAKVTSYENKLAISVPSCERTRPIRTRFPTDYIFIIIANSHKCLEFRVMLAK